jgi:hypothetical protein
MTAADEAQDLVVNLMLSHPGIWRECPGPDLALSIASRYMPNVNAETSLASVRHGQGSSLPEVSGSILLSLETRNSRHSTGIVES